MEISLKIIIFSQMQKDKYQGVSFTGGSWKGLTGTKNRTVGPEGGGGAEVTVCGARVAAGKRKEFLGTDGSSNCSPLRTLAATEL